MEKNDLTLARRAVIIGGSAGSIDVLLKTLPLLKNNLSLPIIVILHRKSTPDSTLADLFSFRTKLKVREAEEKENIQTGTVYLAPSDYHLLIEKDFTFSLDYSEKINYCRPSIDVSFESAAEVFGNQLSGILLSGANADGVEGLKAIKKKGGTTIAQKPETAEVPYMPQQAITKAAIDHIFDPAEIAEFINKL